MHYYEYQISTIILMQDEILQANLLISNFSNNGWGN